MGRPATPCKLGAKRVRRVRCRGGNMKYRALRRRVVGVGGVVSKVEKEGSGLLDSSFQSRFLSLSMIQFIVFFLVPSVCYFCFWCVLSVLTPKWVWAKKQKTAV